MNNWEVHQSGLDLHIYARTVTDLIAGSDGKREVCSPLYMSELNQTYF